MTPDFNTFLSIWIIAGLLLIVVDLFVPTGGVAFFLGLGSIVNAYLIHTGLYDSLWKAFAGWAILSTLLLLVIGGLLMRFVDKRRVKDTVNDVEPYSGDIVEVIEAIDPNNKGRVRFQGAGWTAISKEDQLAIGDKAKIVVRENTTLIVQKANSGSD